MDGQFGRAWLFCNGLWSFPFFVAYRFPRIRWMLSTVTDTEFCLVKSSIAWTVAFGFASAWNPRSDPSRTMATPSRRWRSRYKYLIICDLKWPPSLFQLTLLNLFFFFSFLFFLLSLSNRWLHVACGCDTLCFYASLEKVALPALTRVTRLDSNFDPVPGSTVPRIAPSLLVTYARHDEEVHVALPPVKTSSHNSSHYGAINSASRTQYQHLSQRPANYQQQQQLRQQQQQQQSDNERSTSDGLRHRRVPCRELGEGDCQGWLFRRRQTRGFFTGPRWTRRFFVLKRHTLYGYRDPEVNATFSAQV